MQIKLDVRSFSEGFAHVLLKVRIWYNAMFISVAILG